MTKRLITAGILALGFCCLNLAGTPVADAAESSCELIVQVDGFRNHKGVIGSAVFASPNGWPEDHSKAYARMAVPIVAAVATIHFPRVPPGRYAIVALHDENSNHRLDRNIFRVPREGFGFANNPHIALSAPSWGASAIHLTCPAITVNIHLVYK